MNRIILRRFRKGDEPAVSNVICTTLAVSNRKAYSAAFLEKQIRSYSPAQIAVIAEEAHFYVACDGEMPIGCGGITDFWGSTEESYLTSIFVLPAYQGKGVGRQIVEALEADEYFLRAWRIEVGSSLTAVPFYQKMGYTFRNGITDANKYGVVRLEKRKKKDQSESASEDPA
ncbi:MAG: GNAT family N-acetyltransferase [Clostridia bacterium]|nr:GNAT family N-acetyltransferase [Clostridia bacterium]